MQPKVKIPMTFAERKTEYEPIELITPQGYRIKIRVHLMKTPYHIFCIY